VKYNINEESGKVKELQCVIFFMPWSCYFFSYNEIYY